MTEQRELHAERSRFQAPLLPVAVVAGLFIFVVTYFTYFDRHRTHVPGSYAPLVLGLGSFFCLMVWLNYLALAPQSVSTRLAKAAGIAIAEVGAFFVLLMFLVLNTIGS